MSAFLKIPIRLMWLAALLLVVAMAGCGGGGGVGVAPATDTPTETGTLNVSLTDAPACGFDAVNVTVSKVRVHQSSSAAENDAGWSEVSLNPPKKINLLNLTNGVLESLGQTPLPVGHYTQIRLVLVANTGTSTANSVVLENTTTEIPLSTPSAVQSGIKLINEFDVATGELVELLLDFDACKSVVARGNGSYLLKPVVKVIPTVLSRISGYVVTPLQCSNVAASAQVGGEVIRATVPNAQTGEFLLTNLVPGRSYDVVITADNCATVVIAAVPVMNENEIVLVATNALPISLPPSTTRKIGGTVTLDPPDTSENAPAAFVAAKQSLVSGPTVTVASQSAAQLTGIYELVLPVASPWLGTYGAGTLPIALVEQPLAVGGKYTVEASAAGYVTQSVNKDISAADATQDFTLIP